MTLIDLHDGLTVEPLYFFQVLENIFVRWILRSDPRFVDCDPRGGQQAWKSNQQLKCPVSPREHHDHQLATLCSTVHVVICIPSTSQWIRLGMKDPICWWLEFFGLRGSVI